MDALPTNPVPTNPAPTSPAPTNPAYRPHRVAFRNVLWTSLYVGAWVWVIVALVVALVPHVIDRFGTVELSVFGSASTGPQWFLFVLAIILVAAGLGPHVAQGQTRRTFVLQTTAGFVVVGLVFALVAVAVYAGERWLYGVRGWPIEPEGGHLFTATDQWWLVFAESALLTPLFALSGVAVGATYYRWRGWIGTLLLPVTVGVPFVASDIVQGSWLPGALGVPEPSLGLAALVVVPLAVGLVVLALVALRGAPVRVPATALT